MTTPSDALAEAVREGQRMLDQARRGNAGLVVISVGTVQTLLDTLSRYNVEQAKESSMQNPAIPTIWTDGCGKCRWCAMDMNMDPYCCNPEVKKASGSTVGIGLSAAVQSYCGQDGKLSLFEPRK